jgi:hypothetical protein
VKNLHQILAGLIPPLLLGTLATAILGGKETGIFQWHGPWELFGYMAIVGVVGATYLFLTAIARDVLQRLLLQAFGWLPALLGLCAFYVTRTHYWNNISLPRIDFFEISAQVLPVIILTSVVEVNVTEKLGSEQLLLPLIVSVFGEIACLRICANPDTIDARSSAVVISAFTAASLTLVMGVAARWLQSKNTLESSAAPETVLPTSLKPARRAIPKTRRGESS